MRLLSVNTGPARPIANKTGKTAIDKRPRSGPVIVDTLGLKGDTICDTKHHGGPDQAVYLYGQPDYAFWEQELGFTPQPGLFGENLTVEGLESQKILIGDRFEIGDVLLEATSPRIPCNTFARRMNDSQWVKRFFAANRPGVYARVIRTGTVAAGDQVIHTPFGGEPIALTELMENTKKPAPARMRWLLKTPLHVKLRDDYEARLQALG